MIRRGELRYLLRWLAVVCFIIAIVLSVSTKLDPTFLGAGDFTYLVAGLLGWVISTFPIVVT